MLLSDRPVYDPNPLRPNPNPEKSVSGSCRVRGLGRTLTPLDKVIPLKTFKDASNGYLVDDTCVFGVEVFDGKQRSMDKGECLQLIKDSITNEYQWIVRAT